MEDKMSHKNSGKGRKWRVKSLGVVTLLTFIFSFSTVTAQESVNTTGGNASGSGGSASYSVGQLVYTTSTGSAGSVAQGVQQAWEISVITAIEQARDINLICSAYPNPTSDLLTLKIDNYDNENLSYKLFDSNGKPLESKKISGNETAITMTNLLSGLYFLKVIDRQIEIKTFKIIKN